MTASSGPFAVVVLGLLAWAGFAQAADLFTLSSPAFAEDALLPLKFAGGAACGTDSRGGDTSPPLQWANAPRGTREALHR